MSTIQRLLKAVLPEAISADMEAHSKAWRLTCRTCGHERSIWSIGGVKWKAMGTSITIVRCPTCDRRRAHTVWKREELLP